MRKIIGIILVAGSLTLGYFGVNKINDSSATVRLDDLKFGVSNNSAKQRGYIFLGLAVIILGGGIYTLNKK